MAVCIYRPFRAFHWHSHSVTRESTGCCSANATPRALYTSAIESSMYATPGLRACEHQLPQNSSHPQLPLQTQVWKARLPSAQSPQPPCSTQHPVCSSLRASPHTNRRFACVFECWGEKEFVFVYERVQTTPFEVGCAVCWGLAADMQPLSWPAGNRIPHINQVCHT